MKHNSVAHTCVLIAASVLTARVGCTPAYAQPARQSYLTATPLAEVAVQSLVAPSQENYTDPNQLMMYQPLEEDPLSYYARTQDGEWQIPMQVDRNDPWVRLLILGPTRPTIVDIAIDLNDRPFRAAREAWIDKLLAEAQATFLVRTGEAAAVAAGIEDEAITEPMADSDADEESAQSDEAPEDEAITEDEPQVPMVSAQRRQASSLFKRLINYLAADQSTAQREEVRWLLAEWTGGPAQLTLSPAFAWRRADAAPLWNALDLDGDGVLAAEEIDKSAATLKQADIDRDEIVSLNELERFGKEHSSKQRTKGYPLAVVIDSQTDWNALVQQLRQAYAQYSDSQGSVLQDVSSLLDRISVGDESIASVDLMTLVSLTPDLVYRVVFANKNAKAQLLGVDGTASNLSNVAWVFHSAAKQAITVERAEAYMEMTAAQGDIDEENASGDMQQTQVAIGAVVDGFPLLRLLDQDNNRQLTLREQRDIQGFLTKLDRNHDGQIEGPEIPTAIRLTITHGPFAHQQLADATAAQREYGKVDESTDLPAWFVGMDRNNDGDLSKREFQGSPTQFAKFDQDGDGLISSSEILAADTKK